MRIWPLALITVVLLIVLVLTVAFAFDPSDHGAGPVGTLDGANIVIEARGRSPAMLGHYYVE
jgi:hypothetical protein